MKKVNYSIVFIGAGNVATHFAVALHKAGHEIVQVYSRSINSASKLAEKTKATFTNDLKTISPNAVLFIISTTDAALLEIAHGFNTENKLVVHTSGFHSIEILKETSENTGVFYPLQTFTKDKVVEFSKVPICIEANTVDNLEILDYIAKSVSMNVHHIDSVQRKNIHLAAVFACNFTNFMYQIADEILQQSEVSFDILKPLIAETANKVLELNPKEAQTGLARRNDLEIMKQHSLILNNSNYREIYNFISKMIVEKYKQ